MNESEDTLAGQIVAVITGSNGFVGSHLAEYLSGKGWRVKCIVRGTSSLAHLDPKKVEICPCGLNDAEALRTVFADADYIFHLAGTVKSRDDEGFFRGNVELTKNVLEAALGLPRLQRIVVTSSIAAAGPAAKDGELDETMPCRPIDPYGRSKAQQEELCRTYMDRLPLCIVRPPVVYGERDSEVLQYFQSVKRGIRPIVGVFGRKRLSMVYVGNLVEGLYLCAVQDQALGQTYYFADEEQYDWAQIGRVAAAVMGNRSIALRLPHFLVFIVAALNHLWGKITRRAMMLNLNKTPQMFAPSWMCSCQKARTELGYAPKVGIEEGFRRTVSWYKEHKWL